MTSTGQPSAADPPLSAARDAEEAPPWRSDMPHAKPRVTCYEPGRRPLMRIRVAGAWRLATVAARHDWDHGRSAYQVEIDLPSEVGPITYNRTYWWDARAMRPT